MSRFSATFSTLQLTSEPRHEIVEQFVINVAALWMILHSQGERIIAQFYLFDNVIGCAPGFNGKTSTEFIDCLVMRAVHFFKTMARFAIGSEGLEIVCRLLLEKKKFSNNRHEHMFVCCVT